MNPLIGYEAIGASVGKLVSQKQQAYGNSFDHSGDVLKILYPLGVKPEQYDDLLAMVRIIDKLFRIATDKNALGENPWQDIAGYSLLMYARGYSLLMYARGSDKKETHYETEQGGEHAANS